ncbi:MAG: TolC family protein, partial [Cyclobacteriaceae bacterium]|nr:TolC family protein [Cyclobacteriaceae bacterium]
LQLPASIQMEVEVPALTVEDLILDQSTEQIYDIAKQNLPEIRAAVFRTESANFGLKAAKGNLYPRLNLNASAFTNYSSAAKVFQNGVVDPSPVIGYLGNDQNQIVRSFRPTTVGGELTEKPFSNQISDNLSQSVSLGLNIPIFNAFNARANVMRSRVNKEQAFINLTDVENRLRQAIETAHNDATAAAKTFASSAKAVKAREEAFRMTKQRYDAGASNYVDYQVSENNLFQAKSDQVRAKYDLIFKKKVLDFYQGKPIDY